LDNRRSANNRVIDGQSIIFVNRPQAFDRQKPIKKISNQDPTGTAPFPHA
jgi:hypothetical protein